MRFSQRYVKVIKKYEDMDLYLVPEEHSNLFEKNTKLLSVTKRCDRKIKIAKRAIV